MVVVVCVPIAFIILPSKNVWSSFLPTKIDCPCPPPPPTRLLTICLMWVNRNAVAPPLPLIIASVLPTPLPPLRQPHGNKKEGHQAQEKYSGNEKKGLRKCVIEYLKSVTMFFGAKACQRFDPTSYINQ